jgi:hypothetical protein
VAQFSNLGSTSTSNDLVAKPKSRRVFASVRIITWLAMALFLVAFTLVPQGITVPWNAYFLLFGPVIVVDLTAIVGFIFCRLTRQKISFAYLFDVVGGHGRRVVCHLVCASTQMV